jgi:hypothetical protein
MKYNRTASLGIMVRRHEARFQTTAATGVTMLAAEGADAVFFDRPHFTLIMVPSMSKPLAHACAASSAAARSLKFTNAHLYYISQNRINYKGTERRTLIWQRAPRNAAEKRL